MMKMVLILLLFGLLARAMAEDIYRCDWRTPAPRFWTAREGFQLEREGDLVFLRIREGQEKLYSFNYRTGVTGELGTDYRFSFRFRLGAAPAGLVSGDGAVAQITLNGQDSYVGMTLMDAHFGGGTWFLNGFGLRSGGQRVEFAQVKTSGPIFSTGGKDKQLADTAWHRLALEVRKGSLKIFFDDTPIFDAGDERIVFDRTIGFRPDNLKRLGHLDLAELAIEKL